MATKQETVWKISLIESFHSKLIHIIPSTFDNTPYPVKLGVDAGCWKRGSPNGRGRGMAKGKDGEVA